MKQTEKNFKEKSCKQCGKFFKPKYPGEGFCSDDCRELSQLLRRKELYSLKLKEARRKAEEYNRTHHFCPLCGEPILDGRQNVHFECVLDKWRSGERPQWVKSFFANKGYTVKEVNELANKKGLST